MAWIIVGLIIALIVSLATLGIVGTAALLIILFLGKILLDWVINFFD